MEEYREIKKAYEEIVKVCSRHEYLKNEYGGEFADIGDMVSKAKNHLTLIDWHKRFGLKLGHSQQLSREYLTVGNYMVFSYYHDAKAQYRSGGGRYISWSDDGRQPLDEWLLQLTFGTGAYIFGDDYEGQRQLFQDFFNELKSYKPDFSDSHNNSLYWKLGNAKNIFTNFNSILKKYNDRNREELKQREIDKLESKLNKLKETQ